MTQEKKIINQNEYEIRKIGMTHDIITGRGGMAFISEFVKNCGIISKVSDVFLGIRKNKKGLDISEIIHQIFCYFIDGTKNTLTYFDELKRDQSYHKTIGANPEKMCSSHIIKRFFAGVKEWMFRKLRKVLLDLFIWRLKKEKPENIIIGIDTMVLDNDDAKKREGVNWTYKKTNGYHPLHFYWKGRITNMAFHEGSDAPNHDKDMFKMIVTMVKRIHTEYNKDVQIIMVSDTGFFDQNYFKLMENLGIYYICGGRKIDSIKLDLMMKTEWKNFEVENRKKKPLPKVTVEYTDFRDKRESWDKDRRAIYTKQADEDGQFHLEFDKAESIIYTNLENNDNLPESLKKYLDAKEIILLYRIRALDELVNRSIKEFVDETLPFQSFESNGVYYYLAVIAHNLFKAFQEDALSPVLSSDSYPSTVRRIFIDIAGKIVKKSRIIVIKFRLEVINTFDLTALWGRCTSVIPI